MFPSLQTLPADLATWICLAPYGEHVHAEGTQRVDRAVARGLVRQFSSLWSRLKRPFGGLPIFIGHPDDPQFRGQPGHTDTRAYGWIGALEARDDGLYMRAEWSTAGAELLRSGHYKYLSPRWLVERRDDAEQGLRPVRLLSVGLTNHPAIAGDAISNECHLLREDFQVVLDALGLPDEATVDEVLEQLDLLQQGDHADLPELNALTAELEEARADRLEVAMTAAGLGGWYAADEEDNVRTALANEFSATWARLKRPRIKLKLASAAGTLARRDRHPTARWLDPVDTRMAETGEDFDTAWRALKRGG